MADKFLKTLDVGDGNKYRMLPIISDPTGGEPIEGSIGNVWQQTLDTTVYDVCYAKGVCVAALGNNGLKFSSDDGVTWQDAINSSYEDEPIEGEFTKVKYLSNVDVWVTFEPNCYYSFNGKNWFHLKNGLSSSESIIHSVLFSISYDRWLFASSEGLLSSRNLDDDEEFDVIDATEYYCAYYLDDVLIMSSSDGIISHTVNISLDFGQSWILATGIAGSITFVKKDGTVLIAGTSAGLYRLDLSNINDEDFSWEDIGEYIKEYYGIAGAFNCVDMIEIILPDEEEKKYIFPSVEQCFIITAHIFAWDSLETFFLLEPENLFDTDGGDINSLYFDPVSNFMFIGADRLERWDIQSSGLTKIVDLLNVHKIVRANNNLFAINSDGLFYTTYQTTPIVKPDEGRILQVVNGEWAAGMKL